MDQREKLIDLLMHIPTSECVKGGRAQGRTIYAAGKIAEYLLENGVIVAPMPMADWLKQELTEYVYQRCMEEL